MADSPISSATSHPLATVVVVGVAFAALVLLDALLAALTNRGLYDRLRDVVARIVRPVTPMPAATPAAPGGA